MNEPAKGVRRDDAQEPERQQNYKDGPEQFDLQIEAAYWSIHYLK